VPKFTREIIEAAIAGFEAKKQDIDTQIAELREMLRDSSAGSVVESKTGTKRKLSSAAIQRIPEGQKRRWATARAQSPTKAEKATKPKRKISAAGRKAIAEAQRKRWAAKKATSA